MGARASKVFFQFAFLVHTKVLCELAEALGTQGQEQRREGWPALLWVSTAWMANSTVLGAVVQQKIHLVFVPGSWHRAPKILGVS